MTMRPLSLKTVNKHLMALGYTETLYRASEGYFYFDGPDTGSWYTTSVFVYRLNELTLDQWVAELAALGGIPIRDGQHRLATALTTEKTNA